MTDEEVIDLLLVGQVIIFLVMVVSAVYTLTKNK